MTSTRLAAVLVLALAIAGCDGAASPTPAAVDISLVATEFAYDPNAIEAPAGSQVTFTLQNKGTIEHDLTIESLNVQLYAAVGESPTVTTPALAAGTYEFHCSIAGHKEAGMVGTLVVK